MQDSVVVALALAQREVASNHVAMVSHPDEAVERITTAAKSVAGG